MGLFSEKKTYYFSTTVALVGGEPSDIRRDSILNSILKDRPIADDLITNSLNSFGSRSRYYYNYGANVFPESIPKSIISTRQPNTIVVEDILSKYVLPPLTGINPQPVEMVSSYIDEPNTDDYAYKYLSDNKCGMDYETSILSNAPPSFLYDTDSKIIKYDKAELNTTGKVMIHYLISDLDGRNTFNYSREEDSTFYLPKDKPVGYTGDTYLFGMSKYYLLNNKNQVISELQYWIYDLDSEEYPVINDSINAETGSTYFPAVPLVKDGEEMWVDAKKDTTEWKHYKQLCKLMQLDYQEMGESLKGTEEEPTEDYDEIDFAYINLSIPIQTEAKSSIKYMYRYFSYLEELSKVSKSDFMDLVSRGKTPPISEVDIKDEQGYRTKLNWNYIHREVIDGSIGSVGEYTKETLAGKQERIGHSRSRQYYTSSAVILRYQISENQYIELTVSGLLHTFYIYDKAYETDIAKSLELNDEGELDDDFNIPLEESTLFGLTPVERDEVAYDALRMTITTKKTVKLKWYQTGLFKLVVQVVAIVITIVSSGSGAAVSEIILQILYNMVITYAITYSVMLLVDTLGINGALAAALAIAATVYVGVSYPEASMGDKLIEQVAWTTTHASTAIGTAIQLEYKEIQQEKQRLGEEAQELEEFREDNGLNNTHYDFFRVFGKNPPIGNVENVEEFYYRTQQTNPAIASLSYPQQYVDNMLTLPDLQQYNSLKI